MPEQIVPIHNIESLTEEQRKAYLIQVCEYFDIPSHLNLLEYMRLEGGDGAQHLVLYAKKGATDLIRDRRHISVTEMRETITDKIVMFTVKGQDDKDRTEMAVGVSSIENLSGKELADRIMVAQTRATRRMTLQFIGGGFIDESEVQQVTTALTSASVPPAPPSSANAGATKVGPTPEQLEAQRILAKMDPSRLAKAVGEEAPKTVAPTEPPAPAPKRVRRANKPVDFSLDGPTDSSRTVTSVPEPAKEPEIVPVREPAQEAYKFIEEAQQAAQSISGVAGNLLTKPEPIPGMPNAEQQKEFRARLTKYTEQVLPLAGMVPSEGMGGITTKVRLFVMKRYSPILDLKRLTTDNWNDLLGFFDSQTPADLVKLIDEAVSKK